MKKAAVWILFAAGTALGGCTIIGSFYPLTEKASDYLFKQEFLGKWAEKFDTSGYFYQVDTLPSTQAKLYSILVVEPGEGNSSDTVRLLGHLVNISGSCYLDCWYRIPPDRREYLLARHFFINIAFLPGDELDMITPDPDKVIRLIQQHKLQLHYLTTGANSKYADEGYLILDKPEQLQAAVRESKKFPEVFTQKVRLHRIN